MVSGSPSQIFVQSLIGVIHARRGEPEVWRALDSAIANAAPTGQPQYLVPTRLARTEAFLTEGRVDEARHEAELAADAAHDIDEWMRGTLRRWFDRTGSGRIVDGPVAGRTGSRNPASTQRLRVRGMSSAAA